MVSTPRISILSPKSIGPAGCRINRNYARRGWPGATKTLSLERAAAGPNEKRSLVTPFKV